jgi:hypothetical protein
MKWLAQSTIYRDSIDLLAVIDYGHDREIGLPMQITMTKHELHTAIMEPTLALPPDSAKSLMQALWDAGIRPTEWSNPSGEMKALRNHVEFAEHIAKTLLAAQGKEGVQ